jgi:hypothetical protein
MKPQDFSRKTEIGIKEVVSFLLTKSNSSIQARVNQVFMYKHFAETVSFPTNSAMIQARSKLKPELLRDLNTLIVGKFYGQIQLNGKLNLWNNHLIWAIDGTRLDIPDTPLNRTLFSVFRSGNLPNGKPQALGMFLYDCCNDLPLIEHLGPRSSEPKTFLESLMPVIHTVPFIEQKDKAILVFDRGYTDYRLFAKLIQDNIKFVIRVKTSKTYKSIERFRDATDVDSIINIECPKYLKKQVERGELPEKVKVRAVKVILPSGEVEILITNLFDTWCFPTSCFKELYFKRWPVETSIGFLKNVLDIERFSSKKPLFIYQDFYASILAYTLGALFDKDIQIKEGHKYNAIGDENHKYWYKPNRRNVLTSVINFISGIICGNKKYKPYFYDLIINWGDSQWLPIRSNRSYERNKKTDSGRLVYQLYYKKVYS